MRNSSLTESNWSVDVRVIDAEDAAVELSALRPDGRRWAAAWLVVRSARVPVAVVEVDLAGRDAVPAAEVEQLVAGLAEGAPARQLAEVPDGDLPSISVVVPSDLRRPDQLRQSLTALAELDYPDAEVVLVDNSRTGADEDLVAFVAGLPRVRIVREATPGISAARNAGVHSARGEVIAFTDDDVRIDPSWLRALGSRFALRPDEDVVTGLILPAELESVPQLWFERHYGGFGGTRSFAPLTLRGAGAERSAARRARVVVQDWAGLPVGSIRLYGVGACGAGANMAFRAEALRRFGPFDLALGTGTPARGGEDLAMLMSVLWHGGVLGYEPAAAVFHTHRATHAELEDQIGAYGLGFTATLTSLVVRDPRHLLALSSLLPGVLGSRLPRRSGRRAPAGTSDAVLGPPPPRNLAWRSRWGALQGPGAYRRSRRSAHR